jgi:hypothetical protein
MAKKASETTPFFERLCPDHGWRRSQPCRLNAGEMSAYPVGRDVFFGYFRSIGDWTVLGPAYEG